MLTTFLAALHDEKKIGDTNCEDLCARIDSHIRDLEQLKAFIRETARQRASAIETLIGANDAQLT
ncbi:MAG: hypothetical protein ABFD96_25010 [Armatimonadia bacterium]